MISSSSALDRSSASISSSNLGPRGIFDPATRVLLRTRPSPLTPADAARLRGARPAGPPPQPSADPVRVQRRVSATGVIMVAGQKIALGRVHAGQTVTVLVSDTSLTIQLGDAEPRVIPRTTAQPVRSIKGQRPRAAASDSAAAATVLP